MVKTTGTLKGNLSFTVQKPKPQDNKKEVKK